MAVHYGVCSTVMNVLNMLGEPFVAALSVRAHPRRLGALSVSRSKSVLHGDLYGCAGRVTARNGGFRPE